MLKSNNTSEHRYPFCLFRVPKQGGRVIWEITNTCNYKCIYCIFSSTPKRFLEELPTNEALKVIDQLKESGFTHLKITGGEPFIRPDMIKILQYATDQGFYVDISTNASLLSTEKVKALKNMNIKMVHVSLDGYSKEIQESVRGSFSFERTINGIKKLVEHGLYVRIGSLIFKNNEKKLEKTVKYCIDLGVQEIIFSKMEAAGRMRNDFSLITKKTTEELKILIKNLAVRYRKFIKVSYSFSEKPKSSLCEQCPGGKRFLYIDHKGRVSPCTWVSEVYPQYVSEQTLHKTSFKEIMASPQMSNYLKLTENLAKAGICGCPPQHKNDLEACHKLDTYLNQNFPFNKKLKIKFGETAPIYSFTTENIAGYFPQLNFKNKKILTVTGSGDHIINAYLLGAKEVVSFDVNLISILYCELKIKALKKFNFKQFKDFFLLGNSREKSFSFCQYKVIRESLSPLCKYFFDKVYKKFKKEGWKIRESFLFNNEFDQTSKKISYNLYLSSTTSYKKAQKLLQNKEIKCLKSSLENICKNKILTEQFDLILLSNIADYTHRIFPIKNYLNEFKTEIIEILLNSLFPKGKLAVAYLYNTEKRQGKIHNMIDHKKTRENTFAVLSNTYEELIFPGVIKGYDKLVCLTKD